VKGKGVKLENKSAKERYFFCSTFIFFHHAIILIPAFVVENCKPFIQAGLFQIFCHHRFFILCKLLFSFSAALSPGFDSLHRHQKYFTVSA